MKHRLIKRIFLFMLCAVFIFSSFTSCSNSNKSNSQDSGLYCEPVSIDVIYAKAHTVIRGTVKSKGKPFRRDKDDPRSFIYTPVKIKVSEVYKGENVPKTIVYNELGGIADGVDGNEARRSDMTVLKRGDKVVIFLSDNNMLAYSDGLFKIKRGKINLGKDLEGNDILKNYDEIREMMARLEKATQYSVPNQSLPED